MSNHNISTDDNYNSGDDDNNSHNITDQSDEGFACKTPGCNMTFKNRINLRKHNLTHIGRCEYPGCFKRFVHKDALQRHMEAHLKKKKVFKCEYPECAKSFKLDALLQIHMNRHLGIKKFECDIGGCNRKFVSRNNLEMHKRRGHRDIFYDVFI
ncbi:7935_t:CDS:1 [Entrophospora sp. SA101]|nr:7935_t:CDS:1 [Entrophospora sp. SA101]CAJ0847968.1 2280_t:CDS:1 [Entrophospora sp. SA101]